METQIIPITKITEQGYTIQEDLTAVEMKYQVQVQGAPGFSFTCTPSHLEEMVTGALYSRGMILCAAQIKTLEIEEAEDIRIHVTLKETAPEDKAWEKESGQEKVGLTKEIMFQTVKTLFSNPDTLFNRTGCAHSCSLMRDGQLLCTFEDIGRHNALDKVIGYALRHKIPMTRCILFTSGRISGDYMAKIIHAGIPVAISRAAVTTEAVRLARKHGVTLYGFVRGSSANLYTD